MPEETSSFRIVLTGKSPSTSLHIGQFSRPGLKADGFQHFFKVTFILGLPLEPNAVHAN